ncbi:hypothetical protein QN277_016590 [Acacia crassicarpa]|uniref:Uncharacterized protein n=1 Tax=Acacia crassicarpa TaxID=499986 RepID=A0AAE1MX01_9FABA|nr:hypothetical protein QN277_016590 [Acacia crassicarpa]
MYLEELKGEDVGGGEEGKVYLGNGVIGGTNFVMSDAKRGLDGAGARALFYPTLLYNVIRNKMQAEFRWWDKVDEVWFCNLLIFSSYTMISNFYDWVKLFSRIEHGVSFVAILW